MQEINAHYRKFSSTTEEKLRIVQVAPDIYPVPPKNYGGIERVVYDLVEELVARGHEVFLFAPGQSKTSAKLIPYKHTRTWCQEEIINDVITSLPNDIDIIHDHTHASVIGRIKLPVSVPVVCTEHFSANCPVKYPIYASRTVLEDYGNSIGFFVHHGINVNEFEFSEIKENYLLYIGKIDQSKGPQFAIEASEKTNKLLFLAGPIHDQHYFNNNIMPRILSNPNIHYIGEVGGRRKQDLIKHAECVLFPTLCRESFGLVAIEAMACGTPVLGFANGAVPEVLEFFPDLICKSTSEMIEKVKTGNYPTPKSLRENAENNFSTELMTDGYLKIYRKVISMQ
jgi:glycosyltransferase involved in cell wall biosynthesis